MTSSHPSRQSQGKPLVRSNDRMIAGVCAGLAEYFGLPVDAARIGYVLLSIFSAAFPGILVYLVLWYVMPDPQRPATRG
jgi:phage shock protein PspC (stress-responsive transcriptional regulator)